MRSSKPTLTGVTATGATERARFPDRGCWNSPPCLCAPDTRSAEPATEGPRDQRSLEAPKSRQFLRLATFALPAVQVATCVLAACKSRAWLKLRNTKSLRRCRVQDHDKIPVAIPVRPIARAHHTGCFRLVSRLLFSMQK